MTVKDQSWLQCLGSFMLTELTVKVLIRINYGSNVIHVEWCGLDAESLFLLPFID